MCGEHTYTADDVVHSKGSSPHVRGAHANGIQGNAERGIIPACAGSTLQFHADIFDIGDHPRMCGEHSIICLHNGF